MLSGAGFLLEPDPGTAADPLHEGTEETRMALMSTRTWDEWLEQYAESHQHPINRLCHTFGIPIVLGSVLTGLAALFVPALWPLAAVLFVVGWIFQFVGHAYERKRPEFMNDWRFLFVGLRWWFAKVRGRV